jgi:LuxR family transcriptional regulator, quorum-sensing system regulator SdiA
MNRFEFLRFDAEEGCWNSFFEQISREFHATSALYGFGHSKFTTQRVGLTKSLIIRHNHPEDYMRIVGSERYLNDDIATIAIIRSGEPFLWHQAEDMPWATAEQLAQAQLDKKLGMHVGVSFSLPFAQRKGIGGMGIATSGLSEIEFEAFWLERGDDLQKMVKRFDAHMRPIMIANRFSLSRREREVLAYSAGGLLAKEIAEQIGISPKTVYNTLERARVSMAASTTMEATAKAIIFDLI